MASPFHYFRKHQRAMLAVLGVVLIVTWVVGQFLLDLFGPSPNSGPRVTTQNVVAQWKKGNITRSDLDRMGWEHEAVVSFLAAVIQRAQQEGATPQAPFLQVQQDRIVSLGIDTSNSDESLVQIHLFAEKGKELGVRVDHKAMMDYLNNLGGFVLTESDFHALAQEILSQRRHPDTRMQLVTVTQLYDRLRLELTARQAQEMFLSGLDGFSTGELWEYHGQLHRRYKIEAYPLDVAAYRDRFKAGDAKEEELRKIYQEGKDHIPHPEFPQPGFRQPLRLAFGYVKADFQKFLEVAKQQIPEEKIVEEYQKEISAGNFRKPKLVTPDAVPPPDGKEAAPPSDGKTPGDQEQPPTKPKSGPPPQDSAEKPEESPLQDDEKSCQEEKGKTPDAPADQAAAPTEKAKAGAKDEKAGAAKPNDDQPAGSDATDKPAANASESKPEEPEIRPLSEVREQLLSRLAMPEAHAASDAAIKAVNRAVQDYGIKYARWIESKKAEGKSTAKDPGELKIRSLAEKHHLTFGQTPLADEFEIASTDLGGQAAIIDVGGAVPFADHVYRQRRPLYTPQEANSFLGDVTYIFWRTQEEPSVEVPYDKARPQVALAWIKQQAVEAARKDAEALASKAASAGSLKGVLSEDQAKKVIEPLPFSWVTRSGQPIAFTRVPPRLSEVIGIPLAGQEFMKGVFELKVGQAGVAVNQPHTTVYVVRIVAEEPALDIRREMFLSGLQAGLFGDLFQYALLARRGVMADVVEELRKEYKLQWLETPRIEPEM